MRTLAHQYVINPSGEKLFILLPVNEYERLLKKAEELEDIRLYDEAKADKTPSIAADKAFKMIEAKRKKA